MMPRPHKQCVYFRLILTIGSVTRNNCQPLVRSSEVSQVNTPSRPATLPMHLVGGPPTKDALKYYYMLRNLPEFLTPCRFLNARINNTQHDSRVIE
jgi:hypothetical protein